MFVYYWEWIYRSGENYDLNTKGNSKKILRKLEELVCWSVIFCNRKKVRECEVRCVWNCGVGVR